MNNPWQFLILDRSTATEKDVKSAYARLLKLHRPDRDPEGFQKLREAYEAALEEIRHKPLLEPSSDADDFAEPEISPSPEPAQDAVGWRQSLSALANAVDAEDWERLVEALENTENLAGAMGPTPEQLHEATTECFVRHMPWFAGQVGDDFLLDGLLAGHAGLCRNVFDYWNAKNDAARIQAFAENLAANARKITNADCAVFVSSVAGWMAYWSYPLAAAMLNACFPFLPTDSRRSISGQIEQRINIGRAFHFLSQEGREFWWRQLFSSEAEVDGSSRESQKMMQELAYEMGPSWTGMPVFESVMPEDALQMLHAALRKAVWKRRMWRVLWNRTLLPSDIVMGGIWRLGILSAVIFAIIANVSQCFHPASKP